MKYKSSTHSWRNSCPLSGFWCCTIYSRKLGVTRGVSCSRMEERSTQRSESSHSINSHDKSLDSRYWSFRWAHRPDSALHHGDQELPQDTQRAS